MIHLKSISLEKFKGIETFRCEFDDFTLLAGLNNSGKTSVLQGIYLLYSSLNVIGNHPHAFHKSPDARVVDINKSLSPLGLRDNSWLVANLSPHLNARICGEFSNGIVVSLTVFGGKAASMGFELSCDAGDLQARLAEISGLQAAILTPPGELPTRENMVSCNQYERLTSI